MNKLFVSAALLTSFFGLATTTNATNPKCDSYTSGKDCNPNKGPHGGKCQWVRGEAHGPLSYCREIASSNTPPSSRGLVNPNVMHENRNLCTHHDTSFTSCTANIGTYKEKCIWVLNESHPQYGECREEAPEKAPYEVKLIK